MRTSTCLLAAFFLLSVGSVTSRADQDLKNPRVSFDNTSRNFGEVRQGTVVSQTFAISNTGTSALHIEKVEFSMSGMNMRVQQTIAPGQTADLHITWDTRKYVRDVTGKALLHLNDPEHPKVMLTLNGTVIAPLDFLPRPAFYMSQFEGEEKSSAITIRNNQDTEVHITRLEPAGEHFIARIEEQVPGKQYLLHVTVPAQTPVGRYRESVFVHTDDPERQRIHIEVNLLVKPDIFLVPESVDFGRIDLGQIALDPSLLDLLQQTVVINRRLGLMTIHALQSDIPFLTLRDEPDNPAQSFRLEIGLEKEKLQAGTFKGNIMVQTNDPEFPQLNIPVSIEIVGSLNPE